MNREQLRVAYKWAETIGVRAFEVGVQYLVGTVGTSAGAYGGQGPVTLWHLMPIVYREEF